MTNTDPAGTNNSDELAAAWREVVAAYTQSPRADEVGRALLASWGEPHRRYHNTAHLRDVLSHADELADHAADPAALKLAAWYHDAIYAGQPDDEENSARRSEAELAALGLPTELITEVARLVRLTATHDPPHGDRNGEALSDADLAILAAPADRYLAIRRRSAANTPTYPTRYFPPAGPASCRHYSSNPRCTARPTPVNGGKPWPGATSMRNYAALFFEQPVGPAVASAQSDPFGHGRA